MFTCLVPFSRPSVQQRRASPCPRDNLGKLVRACASSGAHQRALRQDLYHILEASREFSTAEVRRAYLEQSRRWHPDRNPGDAKAAQQFEAVKAAYEVLRDATLRAVYDEAGFAGLDAVISVQSRYERMKKALEALRQPDENAASSEELAFWGLDTGSLFLLEGGADVAAEPEQVSMSDDQVTDARPRSIPEAIANLSHPDEGYRYYAVWWLSRFRVREATSALINVLRHSRDRTSLGGYPLRRRAALALGNIGALEALEALEEALDGSADWHVRHRAAEAIAKILMQHSEYVPSERLVEALLIRLEQYQHETTSNDSAAMTPPGFDLSALDDAKRARLLEIFAKRQADEARARRRTQTPTLGVDMNSAAMQEPYEWLLKALGYSAARLRLNEASWARLKERVLAAMRPLIHHPVPLVQYAAHKALYQATGERVHLQALQRGLAFGAEHHFSQRVLVRDLGELGQLESAEAIASCAMVENSFKVFALRQIMQRSGLELAHPSLEPLFLLLDELL